MTFNATLVGLMKRHRCSLLCVFLLSLLAACGGGGGSSGGSGGGGSTQDVPVLTSITPSSATAGAPAVALTLHGSDFENGATAQWDGTALPSLWVSATEMTATIPASDIASAGTARVSVANPTPSGGTSAAQIFTIATAPPQTTSVKQVAGLTTPQDIAWDPVHGTLYVSISSTDPTSPNTVVPIAPTTATAGTPVAAGNNPDLLAISSDSSYLWVGIDGVNAVQRFLLPRLTKDISIPVPPAPVGTPQVAVNLQAAGVSPHTVALVAGNWYYSPVGEGVYVYDDATQRPISISGAEAGGPYIDWVQWGADDSTIYGNQYTTIDAGGVATLKVTSSGVTFTGYKGGQIGPAYSQFEKSNGILYSLGYAFNPVDGSLLGSFDLPLGQLACTADTALGRYYCVVAYNADPTYFELWVFDLNSYSLLNRIFFGVTAGQPISSITGQPTHLVRWGNAGLALTTTSDPNDGNGGVYLIDGSAVNPNAAPDVSSGATTWPYASMVSLSPQQAPSGSQNVTIAISGTNFTKGSTACWNCSYIQLQFLPTSYVSSKQLTVTIPGSLMATPGPLPISIFDSGSKLFSTNSLAFTVAAPSSGSTQVTALNLAGLAMAWDPDTALLYVGTADYDGAYPNSIVGINGETGSVATARIVGSDPDLVSVSANGQYLYVGFDEATSMTQLQLPGLESPLTWSLSNPDSSAVYWAGDMKAAPQSPHTTAVTLFNFESNPDETGGVVVYDDNVERPDFALGWGGSDNIYDALAWSSSDQLLTGACDSSCYEGTPVSPLYQFQVDSSGAAFATAGPPTFSQGEIHSDFGTGLIYSDDGNVANPTTLVTVGSYNASGLVAPDSSLDRVFILGQTAAQANTDNFTIESFDEKAFTSVSSITLENLLGTPIQLERWGNSGLAVLTVNQNSGPPGLLYLIQDATFVSNAQAAVSRKPQELVQRRWKPLSKAEIFRMLHAKNRTSFP
jgi:DNA-binding beta-propeller fold protein YncE